MIYYLDGYNYLFLYGDNSDPLNIARIRVLDLFCEKANASKIDLTIVFDAHHQHGYYSRLNYQNLTIVYTAKGQSADDFILDEIHFSKQRSSITVISNDKALQKKVSELKAISISFQNFFKKLDKEICKQNIGKGDKLTDKFNLNDEDYYLNKFNF